MKIVRTIARPLLAGVFIAGGMDVLKNPEPPSDPTTAVTLNAMVHIGAGGLLAAGIMSRLAALALATSIVPTTLAAHRFWEMEDLAQRSVHRTQFLKNSAILGGLLVVAFD